MHCIYICTVYRLSDSTSVSSGAVGIESMENKFGPALNRLISNEGRPSSPSLSAREPFARQRNFSFVNPSTVIQVVLDGVANKVIQCTMCMLCTYNRLGVLKISFQMKLSLSN